MGSRQPTVTGREFPASVSVGAAVGHSSSASSIVRWPGACRVLQESPGRKGNDRPLGLGYFHGVTCGDMKYRQIGTCNCADRVVYFSS